jgi:hypothetical protein
MRIVAWCILLAALIFAGASNRLSNDDFESKSSKTFSLSDAQLAN